MNNPKLIALLLRIGLTSVFLYAGIMSLLHPNNWIAFLPNYLNTFIPATTQLFGLAIFQIILALWLLIGWKTFYAALIAAFMIFGIIFVNLNALDITFRDFAILFSAIALSVATFRKTKN